jgi:bacillithiol system protein YtxJ
MNWNRIISEDQLKVISEESVNHPVLIFKHSTTCPISSTALNRLERNWNQEKAGNLKPYLLDLLSYRSVSDAIAEKFGVQHESPQVIVIENNDAVYNESHFGISFEDILGELHRPD